MRSFFVSGLAILAFWSVVNMAIVAQPLDPADDPEEFFNPTDQFGNDIPRTIQGFDTEQRDILAGTITEPRLHREADLDFYLGGVEVEQLYEAAEFPPALVQPVEYLDQYPEDVAKVLTYIGGIPVISSPYIGERTPFDASHLITNFPKTRLDENFLIQRQNIEEFLIANDMPLTDRPFVDISGDLEIFAFVDGFNDASTKGGVDISEIEIDIASGISSWVSGFVSILVDASPTQEGGPPVLNSRNFLEVGFATVGNLNRFPGFATLGQIYVPFGRYVNYLFSTTLPRVIGRVKARAFSLNYRSASETGIYASVYGFDGLTGPGRNGTMGGNLTGFFALAEATGEFGAGIITNIGDATQGLLNFAGFGDNPETLRLAHQVPAVNVYGRVNVWKLGLVGEYVGATRAFNPNDLSQNGHGARIAAWNVQLAYFLEVLERPSALVVGYEGTKDAYALGIPQTRISIGYNTSIWRNTVQQFEFKREIGYSGSTVGNGPIRVIDGETMVFGRAGIPVSANIFNFMMGIYY